MVSHSSTNDQVQVETVSMAISPRNLTNNHYHVSPGQSLEFYEWRFMKISMIVVSRPLPNPFSNSSSNMPSSPKGTSTPKSSTTSMEKLKGTIKTASNSSNGETSMEIMKKEKEQMIKISDEKDKEEKREVKDTNNNKEDDPKVNKKKGSTKY